MSRHGADEAVRRARVRAGAWVAAAVSHVGHVREENQDAWHLGPAPGGGAVFAVFDGLGGQPFGREAAWAAAENLPDALRHASGPDGVLVRLHEHVRPTQGATTAAIAWFPGAADAGAGHLLAVGDSPAFVAAPDGSAARVAPLDREPGTTNKITQCLGEGLGEPHRHALKIDPGRALLLCTDGIADVVDAGHLAAALAGVDLLEAADALVGAALDRGGPDNATAVLARRVG